MCKLTRGEEFNLHVLVCIIFQIKFVFWEERGKCIISYKPLDYNILSVYLTTGLSLVTVRWWQCKEMSK